MKENKNAVQTMNCRLYSISSKQTAGGHFAHKPLLLFLVCVIIKGIVVQFLKIQKFCQRHVERQCNLVQRLYSGIFRQASDNIIQRGLFYIAHGCQFVDCNPSLLAQLSYAIHIDICVIHSNSPFLSLPIYGLL